MLRDVLAPRLIEADGGPREPASHGTGSVLLVHLEGSRRFEVQRDGIAWRFESGAGTCDDNPAGLHDRVRSGSGWLRSLLVVILRASRRSCSRRAAGVPACSPVSSSATGASSAS